MGFFKDAVGAVSTGGLSLLADGGISDTLFGDQGAGAADAQAAQNAADKAFLAKQGKQARSDVLPLFGQAQEQRALSSQQGLDVLGGALPSQLNAFQQGNLQAQQALLGGDFTPSIIPTDTSFIPQQLAQTEQNAEQVLGNVEVTDIDKQLADLQSKFDDGAERGFNDNRGFFTNLERSIRELTRKRSLLGTDTLAPARQFHQVNGSAVRV
tara:strand:+ start:7979 stop:8611 length:633 start_codon:yes stop_codon:yes gene_type:complete